MPKGYEPRPMNTPEEIARDVRDLLLRGAAQHYVASLTHSLNYGHVSDAFRAGAEWERTRTSSDAAPGGVS